MILKKVLCWLYETGVKEEWQPIGFQNCRYNVCQ